MFSCARSAPTHKQRRVHSTVSRWLGVVAWWAACAAQALELSTEQWPLLATFTAPAAAGQEHWRSVAQYEWRLSDGQIYSVQLGTDGVWRDDQGAAADSGQARFLFNAPGNYLLTLRTTDPQGVSTSRAELVTVSAAPTAPSAPNTSQPPAPTAQSIDFTASPATGAAPLTVALQAIGNAPPYQWTISSGHGVHCQNSPSVPPGADCGVAQLILDQPGTYAITLTAGDTTRATRTVTVSAASAPASGTNTPPPATPPSAANRAPVAAIQITPQSAPGDLPARYLLSAQGSIDPDGRIVEYRWRFPNGSEKTGVETTALFGTAGTFRVDLRITDDQGLAATASQYISVTASQPALGVPPQAVFSLVPDGGFVPLIVRADASGSHDAHGAIATYQWQTSDGQRAEGAIAQFLFRQVVPLQTITLTVTDSEGLTASQTQAVKLFNPPAPANTPPVARFTATPAQGDAPLAVTLDMTASHDPDGELGLFQWLVAGELVRNYSTTWTHTLNQPGTYVITLRVYDQQGAQSTMSQTVTVLDPNPAPPVTPTPPTDLPTAPPVNQAPHPVITLTPDTGVAPLVVQADASASTDDGVIQEYRWLVSDGREFSGAQATITLEQTGAYNVTLVVVDDQGKTAWLARIVRVSASATPPATLDSMEMFAPQAGFQANIDPFLANGLQWAPQPKAQYAEGDLLQLGIAENPALMRRTEAVDLWFAVAMPNTTLFLAPGPTWQVTPTAFLHNVLPADTVHALAGLTVSAGLAGTYTLLAAYTRVGSDPTREGAAALRSNLLRHSMNLGSVD